MYSTDKLPELNEKYEKIRTNGIEILSYFNEFISTLNGISENKHKDEVLMFMLFTHKIIIAIGINKDGIPSRQGKLEVYLETKDKWKPLMKDVFFYNEKKKIFYKSVEISSDTFPRFVLDIIIPTLIRNYNISFIDWLP